MGTDKAIQVDAGMVAESEADIRKTLLRFFWGAYLTVCFREYEDGNGNVERTVSMQLLLEIAAVTTLVHE